MAVAYTLFARDESFEEKIKDELSTLILELCVGSLGFNSFASIS